MSLNRSEQMTLDYVLLHKEERQYWHDKVRSVAESMGDEHEAAARLDLDLWHYYVERSQVVEPFRQTVQREGLKRTSMRSLAEYMLRLWLPPKPKKTNQATP